MSKKVRVRFAPSPTGYLHIGGVRTALFNYLFAKRNNGSFILRIEDTDRSRYVAEAEKYILDSLAFCGITLDESIETGGDFGPYRQSDRKESYQKNVQTLIENGSAYYAFDSSEELKAKKDVDQHWQYGFATRMEMKNSLTFDKEETENWLNSKKPYTVRFKMPENEEVTFKDIIRAEVTFNSNKLDDKILMKADGMPTYHLANVCDDFAMQISHVIRGEEWLSSTALHILLYNAFNWEAPTFAHLPLILNPTGPGKLSKRAGKKFGFPVFPLKWIDDEKQSEQPGFKEMGFNKDAFNNMLAFLGWNPGTEQEIFSLDELVENFDLSKVQKSGARFNWEKAQWYNQQYLQKMDNATIAKELKTTFAKKLESIEIEKLSKAVALVKERMTFLQDFFEQANFLLEAPNSYDEKNVKKRYKTQNINHFKNLISDFENLEAWQEEKIESNLKSFLEKNELGFGAILPGFRLLLTGKMGGPSVFAIAEFIGKEATLERMKAGMEKFETLIS